MWRVTLRGLAAAKLRFVLTGLAVVLGTGFVAGALALGDTLQQGFDELFTRIAGAADVQVTAAEDDEEAAAGPAARAAAQAPTEGIPRELLDEVRGLDEVAVADGEIEGSAILVEDGEPVTEFGPPTLAFNASDEPELDASELREGRWPQAEGEIAVDAGTARAQGWDVGEQVEVVFRGPVEDAEIVGVFGVGEFDSLGGASVVLVDRETAFEKLGTEGEYTAILADAAEGVSNQELADAVAAEVGDGYEVRTAEAVAEDEQQALAQFTQVFSIGLLVFAGVSLLVGAFLIFNTFSIVLAQRLRELALLRAVGASRGQLLGSVLAEAAIIGLVGGVLGAGVGIGVARLLRLLLGTVGFELPGSGVVVEPRTVLVALGVGVVVTLVAAVAPARRAVRVPPVTALQQVAVGAVGGRRWPRLSLAAVALMTGVGSLAVGLLRGGVIMVGAGSVAIILGVAGLSSLVAKPLAGAIGWPTSCLRGIRGQLARLNAMRNPRRTAATASALMIGLALVGFVAIFADSVRTSAEVAVERSVAADVILQASTANGISDSALQAAGSPEEVATVAAVTGESLEIAGESRFAAIMTADDLLTVFDFEVIDGDLAELLGGGVAVAESAADEAGLAAGDDVTVATAGGEQQLPVVAVVDVTGLEANWIVESQSYGAEPTTPAFTAYVALADGVSVADGQEAVSGALADFPQVSVFDRAGLVDEISSQVNQLVGVFVALLALSVVIALLGIVNTLALSVMERVHEIGLLRAVGMTRPEVRAMVRSEASIVALLGATLGLVLGLVFGVVFVSAAEEIGVSTLTVPWEQLAGGLVLATVAGLLAGVLPARRAAKLDVLAAVHHE